MRTTLVKQARFIQHGLKEITSKSPNDVVILSALRTPVTRSYKGMLKDTHDHELLSHVIKATLAAFPKLDPKSIDSINIGTVLSELGGSKAGRMAALHAGTAPESSFSTVNRACASGLSAITGAAHGISLGEYDVAIGGGMESMSRNYGSRAVPTALWEELKNSPNQDAKDCVMSMGLTAENVAKRYGVERTAQDEFAAHSQAKAVAAQEAGRFEEEIVPVKCKWTDPKAVESSSGDGGPAAQDVTVTKDDGIRKTTAEKLASMKPAFDPKNGTATAGNSSQISDGASAALLMRRSVAQDLGLADRIIAKWAGTQTIGCKPDEMGIGPMLAIPKLLDYTGVSRDDVSIWEINEAFASQAVYCLRELGLDQGKEYERVNPKGGAIALGHPLGATGGRQVATLLSELKRTGGQLGVVSMCIGTGMGQAALFVNEAL